MRQNNPAIEAWRVPRLSSAADGPNGVFIVPRGSARLRVIASDGGGWDHVSVSLATRCPSWEEMEWVRRLFFRDEEPVMQLHVPRAQHINCHPYCLHLWRPQAVLIPLPPTWMVGPSPQRPEAGP